jgi:DNA-directed RNA polymerase-3 subunit RPC5
MFVHSLNENVGQLHLHPISETHQLRPTLTYLDILSRKNKRPRADAGTDSESDDGPPLDPDEPAPAPSPKHRDKKPLPEAKEAQVTARKAEDKGGPQMFGSLSTVRREILSMVRAEDEEHWQNLEFCGLEVLACRSFPLFLAD